jgi:hypothetical protein
VLTTSAVYRTVSNMMGGIVVVPSIVASQGVCTTVTSS